jgi:hypothetical protein
MIVTLVDKFKEISAGSNNLTVSAQELMKKVKA